MAVTLIHSDQEWQQFAEKTAHMPTVFMYSASWCGPCKRIYPKFQQLAVQLSGSGVAFAKVDVDGAQQTSTTQNVLSMPTFRFHSPDGDVKETRGADESQLRAKLGQLLQRCGVVIQQQQPQTQQASIQHPQQQEQQQQQQQEQEQQLAQQQQEQQQQEQQQQQLLAQQQQQQQLEQAPVQQYAQETQQPVEQQQQFAQSRQQQQVPPTVYTIDYDEQWNEFVSSVHEAAMPLVIEFWKEGNRHCRSMRRVFTDAAANYANVCVFARVNADTAPRVYHMLCNGPQTVPFYTAYDKRGNPIGQFQGARQGKFIDLVHKATDSDR